MRKKLTFLGFAFALLAGSLTVHRADGAPTHPCPQCTTYPDGSQCCVSCVCNGQGIPIACTDNFCPPAGGGD